MGKLKQAYDTIMVNYSKASEQGLIEMLKDYGMDAVPETKESFNQHLAKYNRVVRISKFNRPEENVIGQWVTMRDTQTEEFVQGFVVWVDLKKLTINSRPLLGDSDITVPEVQ